MRQALVAHGRDVSEITALLEADNEAPVVNLVALPGLGDLTEAFDAGFTPGELVADSALSSGGDLSRLESVRDGSVRVQDAGSQLVARALAAVEITSEQGDGEERWLDMCAGPGGKAALLAALAARKGCLDPGQRALRAPGQAGLPGPGGSAAGHLDGAHRRRPRHWQGAPGRL